MILLFNLTILFALLTLFISLTFAGDIPDDDMPTSGSSAGMDASNEQASKSTVI